MVILKHHTRSVLMAITVVAIGGALAGCNWQRDNQGSEPTGGVVESAPTSGGDSAAPSTDQQPAVTGPGGATATTDPLDAEIDKALQELDDLNGSADTLDDEP